MSVNLEYAKDKHKQQVDCQQNAPIFKVWDKVWLLCRNITTREEEKLDYKRKCPFHIVVQINMIVL